MITYECEPVKKIKPRKLNHKANRKAKVYRGSGYNYKQVPQIKLQGDWLKYYGFDIGKEIRVVCEDGKLVRRYIELITIYDDKFIVKFKAGVEIEIKR